MLKNKHTNKICLIVIILTIIIAAVFIIAASQEWIDEDTSLGYENKLFDTSTVHSIDILMEDWEGFLATCTDEEYVTCDIVIDGETYSNVAIRAKGNTSLTSVASYGNDRYSFKIEFDHYNSANTYYGLDKLSLNNLISDNTYMKDYLCYQMMAYMGVPSPLTSFVYITVNGEEWGLYLAVEGIEEAFLQRNYGKDYGELYKPDSMDFGGGRGNGAEFDINNIFNDTSGSSPLEDLPANTSESWQQDDSMLNDEVSFPDQSNIPPETTEDAVLPEELSAPPDGFTPPTENGNSTIMPPDNAAGGNGGGFNGMGSEDVKLQYIDDDPDSYANIFDNAKTDITTADKNRLIESLRKLSAGEDIEEVVDIETVIKYFVVHTFVCNDDSYTGSMVHNYYLYEEDGMLSMIPWDYNLAFGGMGTMGMGGQSDSATAEVNSPIDSPVSDGDIASRPMIAWIFNSEEYTELYHQYYQQFISEFFYSGYFANLLDSTYELIASYVEQDPTAFCSYEEFTTAVETLREFCLLRAESITGQLEGTIPSTEEGQLADSSSLIDASHLSLTAMGEFSNGGGINPAGNNNNQPPELSASSMNTDNMSTNNGQSANSTDNTTEEQQADNRPEEFSRAAPNNTSPTAATANNQWLWLGICIIVLILGLAIAIKAKHH